MEKSTKTMEPSIEPLRHYMNLLTTLPQETSASSKRPAFIFKYNLIDRTYGSPEYSSSGVFTKTTTPWLNDLSTIPSNQLWTKEDIAFRKERGKENDSNATKAKDEVPKQTYSGTVVEQALQRFSKGFFNTDAAPFPTVPAMLEHWLGNDAEFARQRLGANNPDVISRYSETSDQLNARIKNGAGAKDIDVLTTQLQTALKANKLFVCDYVNILGKVRTIRTDQFWTVPVAFFIYDDNIQGLMPVAIQLRVGEYWFTPADAENAWLLAKLYTASADAQWWFSGTHLFNTHSIDMIFGIAAFVSGLPATHPMYMLFDPHMKKVYNINTAVYNAGGTNGIYQRGIFVDKVLPTGRIGLYELVNALYQDYDFEKAAFPEEMKSRGVDKASFPGIFPYRDDGQVWWDALQSFTVGIIDATYTSDSDVENDTALIAWLKEIESAFNNDGVKRFPAFNNTKDQLKILMTNLSYITTAQHTAVNNTMFDGLALVGNGPFSMAKAAPKDANINDDDVFASMPNPQNGIKDITTILTQIGFVMAGTATVDYLAACDINASIDCMHKMYSYPKDTPQYDAVAAFANNLKNVAKPKLLQNQQARVIAFKKSNPTAVTIPNTVNYDYLGIDTVMACIQI